jgi:hypothetical protein
MGTYPEISIAMQTVFADLVEKAWVGNLENLTVTGGSAYARTVRDRKYWYWQPPSTGNGQPSAKYLGPDNEQTRSRIAALRQRSDNIRQRREMVRALRAARLPAPDTMTGDILAAMAEAGVFRMRAVVVGSVAFQSYYGTLGVYLPATLTRTGDLDLGQFESIALAVKDGIDANLEDVLRRVDGDFIGIPDPMDGRRTLRYALRKDGEEKFSVDVLSPLRGPDRSRIAALPALRSDAQLLRYLDFLLYLENNSVSLHGAGIPINVPDPTRYALHKLVVSQMRRQDIPRSRIKARKDLDQAEALIRVLAKQRPGDLEDLWRELRERGPSWRQKADAALRQLPQDIQILLPILQDPDSGSSLPTEEGREETPGAPAPFDI